ncbi:MAG: hypothetical protein DRP74_05870 [Candidatus Omnitrophota bacterium]|nr:MAG: hypothetical protein DRP74_05870 [Candidatus Omnitrophota bacterium]
MAKKIKIAFSLTFPLVALMISTLFCEEIIFKTKVNEDTVESVFFKESEEIAKITTDIEGNIIQKTGKIPDG